jgi:hypothetical protein
MLFRLLRRRKYLKDKSTRFRAVESILLTLPGAGHRRQGAGIQGELMR